MSKYLSSVAGSLLIPPSKLAGFASAGSLGMALPEWSRGNLGQNQEALLRIGGAALIVLCLRGYFLCQFLVKRSKVSVAAPSVPSCTPKHRCVTEPRRSERPADANHPMSANDPKRNSIEIFRA